MVGAQDQPGISLRDAIKHLSPNPKNLEYGKLLGFLKTGHIKAGFRCPASGLPWVEIQIAFWSGVHSAKFKTQLRFNVDDPSSGAFLIRLADFATDIGQLIGQGSEPAAWVEVLAATKKQYEVEILQDEWLRFTKASPESVPRQSLRSPRGRDEKESWRRLSVLIGAYVLKHSQSGVGKPNIEAAAGRIHEIAEKEKIPDLPKAPTIQNVVSEIYALLKTISI
jgi:hypothetical protein